MTKRTVDFTGSVSSGTTRVQDLVPSFLEILAEYWPEREKEIVYTFAYGYDNYPGFSQAQARGIYDDLCSEDDHDFWNGEECNYILSDIFDAMDAIAPDHYYFGAHPGDGANYGFWLHEDIARFLYDVEEFLHNRMSFGEFKKAYRQFKNDNDIELAELKKIANL